jgi:dihydroorotase
MIRSIQIRKPNDFHHHLRDGEMLDITANECFNRFNYIVVMPNLKPPIYTIEQANQYKNRIMKVNNKGTPLMTLYLSKNISESDLYDFKNNKHMIGIKYYPKAATTNSEQGVSNIKDVFNILKIMEQEDIPLLIHGESIKKNVDIFDKEHIFLEEELLIIITNFPKLRIVLEHITTKKAVDFVLQHNIHATITPHHLLLDRNDIFKNGINPHLYCLPILKRSNDREALLEAALSGKPNFFLGTDSAPHCESNKLTSCGCAGIFNCTVAIEIIVGLFDKYNKLEHLDKFISTNGCDFYNLKYNEDFVRITNEKWVVPDKYGNIVPLYAGKELDWKCC